MYNVCVLKSDKDDVLLEELIPGTGKHQVQVKTITRETRVIPITK